LGIAPFPNNSFPFKAIEGFCYLCKVLDEASIEVDKTREGKKSLEVIWNWPFCYSFNLYQIHLHCPMRQYEPHKFHLFNLKDAFLWLEEQVVGCKDS
jgi:hypothetical protein